MSAKNTDQQGRWRNKTVAFRVSPEEDAQIERFVALSGMSKQDYITSRLLEKEIVVKGNPRVFKALKEQFTEVLSELKRIDAGESMDAELLELIRMITVIMEGMADEK